MKSWCFAYNSLLVKASKVSSVSQKILRHAQFIAETSVSVLLLHMPSSHQVM